MSIVNFIKILLIKIFIMQKNINEFIRFFNYNVLFIIYKINSHKSLWISI